MKTTRYRCSLFLAALFTTAVYGAAGAEPAVTIAPFNGNRRVAVSYTFDDGTLGHYAVAAPLLEKYGLRGTFFVIPGRTPDEPSTETIVIDDKGNVRSRPVSWREWRELAARGHEVANHGLDHKKLSGLSDEEATRQVREAQRIITEKVGHPITFCYPGNGRDARVREIVLQTHIAARETESRFGGTNFTAAAANRMIDNAIKSGGQRVVMIHAVAEPGYQPLSEAVLSEHLKYVAGLKNDVWVDTFANVSCYVQERAATKIEIFKQAANQISFCLKCPLNANLFNCALTCIVDAGSAVASASARYDNHPADLPIACFGNQLLLDIVPGMGSVTVHWINKGER